MFFALLLDLNNLSYSGYIPNLPKNAAERVEIYQLSNDWDDVDLIYDDIDCKDGINDSCDSLLGYGDVDYLDAVKCKKMYVWIENRLKKAIHPRYKEILLVLQEYCKRAAELNTGVVIDL